MRIFEVGFESREKNETLYHNCSVRNNNIIILGIIGLRKTIQ